MIDSQCLCRPDHRQEWCGAICNLWWKNFCNIGCRKSCTRCCNSRCFCRPDQRQKCYGTICKSWEKNLCNLGCRSPAREAATANALAGPISAKSAVAQSASPGGKASTSAILAARSPAQDAATQMRSTPMSSYALPSERNNPACLPSQGVRPPIEGSSITRGQTTLDSSTRSPHNLPHVAAPTVHAARTAPLNSPSPSLQAVPTAAQVVQAASAATSVRAVRSAPSSAAPAPEGPRIKQQPKAAAAAPQPQGVVPGARFIGVSPDIDRMRSVPHSQVNVSYGGALQ